MEDPTGKSSEEIRVMIEESQKEVEQIKRENQLFESYLLRASKEMGDYEVTEKRKEKKRDKEKRTYQLTAEEKHNIATQELQALKKDIEEGRGKSEALTDELKAMLEETDMQISSIKKEAFEFKREIVTNGENERTGKVMAEKLEKYIEEMKRKKEDLREKLEKKNKLLQTKVVKAEQQIKQKEELGDELKFIDFHQLEIENKKHVKEIDEKNKKLLSLKSSSNNVNKELGKLNTLRSTEEDKLNNIKSSIKNIKRSIKDATESTDKVKKEEGQLVTEFGILDGVFKARNMHRSERDFIKLKKDVEASKLSVKQLERTIEIHKSLAKAAKKILESQKS